MAHHQKQYGLILPDRKKGIPVKKPSTSSKSKNVFGDGSSGDEESNVDWVKQSLKKQSHGSMQQKASMKVMKEALQDDPSVYEYDEVYDDMVKKKEELIAKNKADKKPKYIEDLIKTAKQRELENELRKEREAQRERENEGDMYADKEAFVTSSFKKKMEEIRKMQDDQAYKDAIDDVTDVTKQKDMSGFYRQLYRETMKNEPDPENSKKDETDSKKDTDASSSSPSKIKRETSASPDRHRSRSPNDKRKLVERNASNNDELHQDSRRRRSRSRSGSASRNRDIRRRQVTPLPSNRGRRDYNRDRDFRDRSRDRLNERRHQERRRRSRSRSRGRDRDQDRRRRSRSPDRTRQHRDHPPRDRHIKRDDKDIKERTERRSEKDKKESKEEGGVEEIASPTDADGKIKIIQKSNENWFDFDVEIEQNVKKSFYVKRTVGQVFDDALRRYLERKANSQVVTYK